jgi:hypothetical protein
VPCDRWGDAATAACLRACLSRNAPFNHSRACTHSRLLTLRCSPSSPASGAIELDWADGADTAVWRWIWPEPEHTGWLSTLPAGSERQDVFG